MIKKIVIIGGTGGLGSKVSKSLHGYEVTVLGSKDLDISNSRDCEIFFRENPFDIVLNFAGVNFDSFIHKLTSENEKDIEFLLNVNLKGTVNVVSSCLKYMRTNNYGRIILISSVLAEKTVVGTALYSSCKAFIDKFVKNVSYENVKYGITANTIQLGYFDGGMTYRIPEDNLESIRKSIGLQRFGKIEELVNTIEYFINTEYTTGINLKIDGCL